MTPLDPRSKPVFYTLGYAGLTPEQLRAAVVQYDATLLDVRLAARSPAPQWRKSALVDLLGDRYHHLPALGNRNYRNGGRSSLPTRRPRCPWCSRLWPSGRSSCSAAVPTWRPVIAAMRRLGSVSAFVSPYAIWPRPVPRKPRCREHRWPCTRRVGLLAPIPHPMVGHGPMCSSIRRIRKLAIRRGW